MAGFSRHLGVEKGRVDAVSLERSELRHCGGAYRDPLSALLAHRQHLMRRLSSLEDAAELADETKAELASLERCLRAHRAPTSRRSRLRWASRLGLFVLVAGLTAGLFWSLAKDPVPFQAVGPQTWRLTAAGAALLVGELGHRERIVPAVEGGLCKGLEIQQLGPDSFLGKLGFEEGDVVRTVDGFAVCATSWYPAPGPVHTVALDRGGERVVNVYRVSTDG